MNAENNQSLQIETVSTPVEIKTKQNLPYFLGISNNTTNAKNISMNLVVIPPGGNAEPHYHMEFESAIYLLEGEVETRYGENLEHSVVNTAGDFVYVPPNLLHQPFNCSKNKAAKAIVVRNNASELENVAHLAADVSCVNKNNPIG